MIDKHSIYVELFSIFFELLCSLLRLRGVDGISEKLLLALLLYELQHFILLGLEAFITLHFLTRTKQTITSAHVVGLTVILEHILHHLHSLLLELPLKLILDLLSRTMLAIFLSEEGCFSHGLGIQNVLASFMVQTSF
jgi:hypothetical protein